MKTGDLVKWRGWPELQRRHDYDTGQIGIVIGVVVVGLDKRINVMWSDGRFGTRLFHGTLELIK